MAVTLGQQYNIGEKKLLLLSPAIRGGVSVRHRELCEVQRAKWFCISVMVGGGGRNHGDDRA